MFKLKCEAPATPPGPRGQVIWGLRVGATLWGLKTVIWEPGRLENHEFYEIMDFHDFRFFIKETGLEDFNRPELLQTSSFQYVWISAQGLNPFEFTDFLKYLENLPENDTFQKIPVKWIMNGSLPFVLVEYYFQRANPLLCKLFEDCALAQRSEASETWFESWSAWKSQISWFS